MRRLLYLERDSGLLTVVSPVSIVVYVACAIEFFLRFDMDKPIRKKRDGQPKEPFSSGMTIMTRALIFSTTCIFIRYVNLRL